MICKANLTAMSSSSGVQLFAWINTLAGIEGIADQVQGFVQVSQHIANGSKSGIFFSVIQPRCRRVIWTFKS